MVITTELFSFLLQNQCIVLGLILVTSSYFLLRKNPRVKYYVEKIDGPPSFPVVGSALYLLCPHRDVIPIFKRWADAFNGTYRFWLGNILVYVFVSDARTVEKLISGSNNLEKGKHEYSLFTSWLGTGLLTAPVSKWSGRRKLLTPSFHFKILEDFIPIFNEQASIMLQCLQQHGHENGKTFNMYQYITNCTLDIICETAMGKKINAQTSSSNKEYIDAVNGQTALILERILKPWLRVPILYEFTSCSRREKRYLNILKTFTWQVIEARKQERKLLKTNTEGDNTASLSSESEGVYGKRRKAFLDLMLDCAEETNQLTDSDIREEVDTFMFEGQDTTAMNLTWTILMLSMHQRCQKLLQEELDEIFADDPNRDVTIADISKMKYLECCVKESLRLYPSVPFIMRQMYTDVILDDGKIIPKGATALIAIYFLHRDPQVFPEPEKFIPERFANETTTKRHPYAYIPFSAGPRNCIGQKFALMEEKIILAKLFRTYAIETSEKMENLKPLPDAVLRCENGVHVRLRKR